MNVILVANDNKKNGEFLQWKPEVLTTVSNLLFLKQMYPEYNYVLYVDSTTEKYYGDLGITQLFDEINTSVLNRNYSIDKKAFWAYSKIFALRATPAPCVIFDLDFRVFDDIRALGYFSYDVGAFCLENIKGKYYYSKPEECLQGINVPRDFDWDEFSVNVSSLYFKDSEFKNIYCDWVINYMYDWSFVHKNDTMDYGDNIILFSEQYMLNQLIKKHNKTTALLVDDTQEEPLPKNYISLGLNKTNNFNYVYHFGRTKTLLVRDSKEYNIEIDTIVNYANLKIKDQKGLEILNNINTNKQYERYFR